MDVYGKSGIVKRMTRFGGRLHIVRVGPRPRFYWLLSLVRRMRGLPCIAYVWAKPVDFAGLPVPYNPHPGQHAFTQEGR